MKISMPRFAAGLVIGLIALPLFVWLYFRFGYAPVATASAPMLFEKQLAHMALKARIRKEAAKNSILPPSDENYQALARMSSIAPTARLVTGYQARQ